MWIKDLLIGGLGRNPTCVRPPLAQPTRPAGLLLRLLHRPLRLEDTRPRLAFDKPRPESTGDDPAAPNRIPTPIVSRTRLFQIEPPNAGQLRDIAQAQFRRIVQESRLPFHFDPTLPCEIAQAISSISPREIGVRLEIALGKAVAAGRRELREQDWLAVGGLHRAPRMGFC